MVPVASTAALQRQERVFQLEVEQKGNSVSTNQNLTDSVSLCFAPLVLPLSVVPPLMGSLFFLSSCMLSLFLSPPFYPGVLLCIGLVLIVAQKSLLMTVSMEMWKNMPASMKENENSFHCCLLFFYPPCSFPCVFVFPPPPSPHEISRWLHLVFISRHFLAVFKTQCVWVWVWDEEVVEQN